MSSFSAPPGIQSIHIETMPDQQTTRFRFGTTSGEICCALEKGSFSQFLELLLKHAGDIAAKSPQHIGGPIHLTATPIPVSGIGHGLTIDEAHSVLVVFIGNLRLSFQVDIDALVKLSSAIVARFSSAKSTDLAPEKVKAPPETDGSALAGSYLLRPTGALPVMHKIQTRGPTLTYPALGACAYCGSKVYREGSTLALTAEHIVADGFGGTLVLPTATCESHQKITTTIEGSILRTIFHAPRARLGIQGRKKSRKRTSIFPVKATVNGREITIPLSLEDHPTILYLIMLGPPGILVGRPKQLANVGGVWVKAFNLKLQETTKKHGVESFISDVTDTKRFYQFLAKTAHALAIAELGLNAFTPFLRGIIEGKFVHDRAQYLIGGYPEISNPTEVLHEVGLEQRIADGKTYIVARLRFFANLGAPTYCVVVGERHALNVAI